LARQVRNRARGEGHLERGAGLNSYRIITFVAAVVGVVLFLYYPERWLLIIAAEIVFSTLLWFIAMKPVPEPDRAVVFRLATFHHIAGPGYIFLVPTLDRIEGVLDMTPQEIEIEVPQVRTADSEYVRTNLEVTWRISPDVQGRLSGKMREMIHMSPERRAKIVQEEAIHIARQVVNSYTLEQFGVAANRESAMATMTDGVNEKIAGYGLLVDRVFWRGSPFPAKLNEARLEGAIRLERAQSLIKMIEAFKKRLPEMQPEEIMALDAWLDTFSRGGGPTRPSS
jgi:regulator of protease activity HflC (stomatin/prohibitin superfamily)